MFRWSLIPDPSSPEAALDLSDRARLHRKLMGLFPDYKGASRANGRERFGILFRVAPGSILGQSRIPPDAARAPGGYRLSDLSDTPVLPPGASAGAHFQFVLEANTSFREPGGGSRRGLRDELDRRSWLVRRAETAGFGLVRVSVRPLGAVRGGRAVFEAVSFEGILRLAEPALLARAVENGIGQGKAYGFGLLLMGTRLPASLERA